jgi:hypothetical protein
MKERPILMSAPMVRAILEGIKTQTRRALKRHFIDTLPLDDKSGWVGLIQREPAKGQLFRCRYGVPGDLLWVRESGWQRIGASGTFDPYYYDASVDADMAQWLKERPHAFRRRPSIHMPRAASRITLKITDVRCEQLTTISNEDAAAEGWPGPDQTGTIRSSYPIAWYSRLWESINGIGSWDASPWVWALTFERVK